jgi:hypothetical protein
VRKLARCAKYPALMVAELFESLARTDASLKELMLRRGYTVRQYRNFLRTVWSYRPDWLETYKAARAAKVLRARCRLLDVSDEQLLALGRRGIRQERYRIERLRPITERRADARQCRAEKAAVNPVYAARQRARRHGKT